MNMIRSVTFVVCFVLASASVHGDIYRSGGEVIPGTEGITPGPGVQLDHLELQEALLFGFDLSGSTFAHSNLRGAQFNGSTLAGADFAGARVNNVGFVETVGLTAEQVYSTGSYHAKDLSGILFNGNNLSGWNLGGQDLSYTQLHVTATNANLSGARLTYAQLSGDFTSVNLSNANLERVTFVDANLSHANLNGANLQHARLVYGANNLHGADLTDAVVNAARLGANLLTREQLYSTASYKSKDLQQIVFDSIDLTGADLSGQNLTGAVLQGALTAANFSGAIVSGTGIHDTTPHGFTKEQLYSTASYQAKDLRGIGLYHNDLSGWDFSGQNLAGAFFSSSTLTNANLTGAVVTGAYFDGATSQGFTKEQLYATQSYQAKNLQGVGLYGNDLTGWDFDSQNLTGARFGSATITNAILASATITGAWFHNTTSRGFTKELLYSTASYAAKSLREVGLGENDLASWDFSDQDLENASFFQANLAGADFSGAIIRGANLVTTTSKGFRKEQLYSTASYAAKDLSGIELTSNDLTGWNFHGQNLANADFNGANLTNANLSDADLAGARFSSANLSAARLDGAKVVGTNFEGGGSGVGISKQQLYSTASYQEKDLRGIDVSETNLSGWNFRGQNLTNAVLGGLMTNADLSGADLRGARYARYGNSIKQNMITPNGAIAGLHLSFAELLLVRDYYGDQSNWNSNPPIPLTIPIIVRDAMSVSDGGIINFILESDAWDSLISFEPGIPVQLGGTLELTFADNVNVASQVGRTLRLFDWTGVSPVGQLTVASRYRWDTSKLYATGEVTLLAVPEPSALLVTVGGVLMTTLASIARRRWLATTLALVGLVFLAVRTGRAAPTISEATIPQINQWFDAGALTSERLVQVYLDRIAVYDDAGPKLNSLITVAADALATARQLDVERRATGPRSPLHGIPVILKDNIDAFDLPTTAGSLSLRDSIPPDDAFLVKRLRDAGAIIFGKANLDEFGLGLIGRSSLGGQTLNAYDQTKVPFGSSGGTGVAVTANLAAVGIGVDAIGSIRMPSSAASLVGLKPTLGLVSRDGIMAYDRLRETAGPMTRTVTDLALVMDAIAAPDAADPWTADSVGKIPDSYVASLRLDALQHVRLGRVPYPSIAAMRPVVENAYAELRDLGANLDSTVNPSFLPGWYGSLYDGFEHDMNRYLESLGPNRRFADLDSLIASREYLPLLDSFWQTLKKGDVSPQTDKEYHAILELRTSMRQRVLDLMDRAGVDALIYPTLATYPAPVTVNSRTSWFGSSYFDMVSDAAFLGFPAITVPAGFSSDGLPLGIEFMGRPYSDADLIGYAYAYEQATRHRRPPAVTPPLPGEAVPEPSSVLLAAAAMGCAFSVRREYAVFHKRLRHDITLVSANGCWLLRGRERPCRRLPLGHG